MKFFSLAIVTTLLLTGCAHQASYDSLGGYGSSDTSYSVGVSSGYPAYGYGYAPAYRPYYVPYGGHRHYHDGHDHHRHDRDRDGKGQGHDRGGKQGDRPNDRPRPDARPPSRSDNGGSRDRGISPASSRRSDGSLRSDKR